MTEIEAPVATDPVAPGIAQQLASYRAAREEVERSVLPLATSLDGRTFTVQSSLHDLQLRRGGYVQLTGEGGSRLGQLTQLHLDTMTTTMAGLGGTTVTIRAARGSGIVLDGDGTPFHDARAEPAPSEALRAWAEASRPAARAGLHLGHLVLAPEVPAVLDAGGFDRHTFLCGQSGSGKTYSLGLLLERLLLETTLPLVVLDPNSDYVGLGRLREGGSPELAQRYAGVPAQVKVWSNGPSGDVGLHLRFPELSTSCQAAILDLHPIRDRDEYAGLQSTLERRHDGAGLVQSAEELFDADDEGTRALGRRARNLGVLEWSLWDPEAPSLIQELENPTSRCTVVDLGSLDDPAEQSVVSEAVLSTLWRLRMRKTPVLVVMDEAHNICPAAPPDAVSALTTQRAVQIAAEGRKFGLYLLTSTQRPHKVHEGVVSQCDNLMLMRMNSAADLEDLGRVLSFAPPGLVEAATTFRMGQALIAGKVMPQAAYVQMGERISREGGADVPTTWASAQAEQ